MNLISIKGNVIQELLWWIPWCLALFWLNVYRLRLRLTVMKLLKLAFDMWRPCECSTSKGFSSCSSAHLSHKKPAAGNNFRRQVTLRTFTLLSAVLPLWQVIILRSCRTDAQPTSADFTLAREMRFLKLLSFLGIKREKVTVRCQDNVLGDSMRAGFQ